MKKPIFLGILCCILLILTIPVSSNTFPKSDSRIAESNQTKEAIPCINALVNATPIPSPHLPTTPRVIYITPILGYGPDGPFWIPKDSLSPDDNLYQKRPINISKLERDIEEAPYQTWEYKRDSFDCSNMAGVMVEHLDSRGWNAEIIVGDSKTSPSGCIHAFIIVNRRVTVAPTLKIITYAEGRENNLREFDFFINTWDIIGVYQDREDAIERSWWSYSQWGDFR